MDRNESHWAVSRAILPGDRVRLRFGPLADMTGKVTQLSDRHRVVVKADKLKGVYIVVPADELERLT